MNMIVVNNLIIIFGLIAVGFFAGRGKILSDRASADFTSFLMKVTLPCTIFSSMIREYNSSLVRDSIIIFILGLVFFAGLNTINLKVADWLHVTRSRKNVWVVSASMCNIGFMGFPLILAIFGGEGLFLASIMNLSYNIVAWSYCAMIASRDSKETYQLKWKNIVLTNNNYAVALGLVFFLGQIPVHSTILTIVNYFGNITTPISMFLIGLTLADGKLYEVFRDKDVISCTIIRLLVVPVLVVFIMKALPLASDSILAGVVSVIMAMPCPSVAMMLAQQYNCDTSMAARAIFLSSLCCIVTIPLIMMLL